MEDHPTPRPFVARAVVLAAALAVAVGLVASLGGGADPEGEALPDSPVQGMVAATGDPLATAADPSTTRPVLQVVGGVGESGDGSAVAGPSSSSTSTVSTVPSTEATSTTVVSTSSTASVPAPTSTASDAGGLSSVEQEIVRLTNELRTDPNGPLRREGPVPNCDGRLAIDQATGLYLPVPPVTVHVEASLVVARPWSERLTTQLEHQLDAGIPALVAAGIPVSAAGENIAYHNFPDTAFRHFAGWRESDGHFCNLMDPTFTHLGVGESTRSDGFSYATQNFFSMQ